MMNAIAQLPGSARSIWPGLPVFQHQTQNSMHAAIRPTGGGAVRTGRDLELSHVTKRYGVTVADHRSTGVVVGSAAVGIGPVFTAADAGRIEAAATPAGQLLLQTVRRVVQSPEVLADGGDRNADDKLVFTGSGLDAEVVARSL